MRGLSSRVGRVFLVGSGPGDPELLTLKGLRCLNRADVVVYDRLVDSRVLNLSPASAERILVGKKGGHYSFPQEKINELLASKAQEGKQVVRLKGGDPFVFGRGGEEATFLAESKIPFEIVPGVSSALAVPAAAGIPVTHRDVSSSIAIITGHQGTDTEQPVEWEKLATATDTLVVLMPLGNLRGIVSKLVLHGRPLDTPAALLEAGTLEGQREAIGTLRSIVRETERIGIQSPALLVVGRVVEFQPLIGQWLRELETAASASPDPGPSRRSRQG